MNISEIQLAVMAARPNTKRFQVSNAIFDLLWLVSLKVKQDYGLTLDQWLVGPPVNIAPAEMLDKKELT